MWLGCIAARGFHWSDLKTVEYIHLRLLSVGRTLSPLHRYQSDQDVAEDGYFVRIRTNLLLDYMGLYYLQNAVRTDLVPEIRWSVLIISPHATITWYC